MVTQFRDPSQFYTPRQEPEQSRGTSSASYETAVNITLTVGGISDIFTITTTNELSVSFTNAIGSQYIPLFEDI